jgi:hypothetical protein
VSGRFWQANGNDGDAPDLADVTAIKITIRAVAAGAAPGSRECVTLYAMRILSWVMTAVLIGTVFLAASCLAGAGDDDCCSICFCCHNSAVIQADAIIVVLHANSLTATWPEPFNPLPSPLPGDKPPRS